MVLGLSFYAVLKSSVPSCGGRGWFRHSTFAHATLYDFGTLAKHVLAQKCSLICLVDFDNRYARYGCLAPRVIANKGGILFDY